jgi:hypothetical protein
MSLLILLLSCILISIFIKNRENYIRGLDFASVSPFKRKVVGLFLDDLILPVALRPWDRLSL